MITQKFPELVRNGHVAPSVLKIMHLNIIITGENSTF